MSTITKLSKQDARELTDNLLAQAGTTFNQIGHAIRMGAHTAAGLERREFVALFGVRAHRADAENQVKELHAQGLSAAAIADILGMSPNTVAPILAGTTRKQIDSGGGDTGKGIDSGGGDTGKTLEETLTEALEAEKLAHAQARAAAKKFREKVALEEYEREAAELAAMRDQSPAAIERRAQESAARQAEMRAKVLGPMSVAGVVRGLEYDRAGLSEAIEMGAVDGEAVRKIDAALTAFLDEWTVAQATASQEVS